MSKLKSDEGQDAAKRVKRNKGEAQKLRDAGILAMNLSGKSTTEIASQTGLSRSQVSRVLNSDEIKALVKGAEGKIAGLIDKSVAKVDAALDSDNPDQTNGLKAALAVLKNFGLMRDSVDLNHSFPKPMVITRPGGVEVVLGTAVDRKDESKG